MADFAREDGVEPETRSISPDPSQAVLEPEKRLACDHVLDGEPVAGFVSVRIPGVALVGNRVTAGEALVDLCGGCWWKVQAGGKVTAYNHDRRHGEPRDTRPSSSVVEHPADNREVAAKTTSPDAVRSLGFDPCDGLHSSRPVLGRAPTPGGAMSPETQSPHANFAHVLRIKAIEPHPDPEVTRLEVIELTNGVKLVTGKHYRVGLLGIHLKPGCLIPGWLAEQLWLVGKKRATAWFQVREIEIKGVASPGLFCGAEYMNDGSDASSERYGDLERAGGEASFIGVPGEGRVEKWITWPYWREHWAEGHTLDGYLGVVPVPEPIVAKPFGEAGFTTHHVIGGELPVASGVPGWKATTAGGETISGPDARATNTNALPIVPRD